MRFRPGLRFCTQRWRGLTALPQTPEPHLGALCTRKRWKEQERGGGDEKEGNEEGWE